jgi:hypothetical protein
MPFAFVSPHPLPIGCARVNGIQNVGPSLPFTPDTKLVRQLSSALNRNPSSSSVVAPSYAPARGDGLHSGNPACINGERRFPTTKRSEGCPSKANSYGFDTLPPLRQALLRVLIRLLLLLTAAVATASIEQL